MSGHLKNHRFTPQEDLVSILPSIIAGIVLLLATTITALLEFSPTNRVHRTIILLHGVFGSIYLVFFYLIFISRSRNKIPFLWVNSLLAGTSIGLLTLILPKDMDFLLGLLVITAVISSSIFSERGPAYLIVASATLITLVVRSEQLEAVHEWVEYLGLAIIAVIALETIQQLRRIPRQQINRLEIVNNFSREITSTLDTQQVTTLLNAAIQNALEADTYYVGLMDGAELVLNLFYDDGEYFTDVRTKIDGSLSGWVIRNQKGLFLPDLQQDIELADVRTVIIGKQKTSLSWMGVPMKGEFTNGIIAIASYRPYAFGRSDMELLSNMSQRAALALDNTYRHAIVEEQTHIDSLTGVFNHGYFLKILKEQADVSKAANTPLSLIMLDVDHFKHYNDTYGHLAGDEILTKLCDAIRRHIKRTDAVGRWGGEEFVISLPNTSGFLAMQVADRIRETMANMTLMHNQHENIPVPTVSQGIAELPMEVDEIFKLIDLADKRLYIAKNRGRNQVEPNARHWNQLQVDDRKISKVPKSKKPARREPREKR
jgi:diguanylate cyclase (GGDEF)-like protein